MDEQIKEVDQLMKKAGVTAKEVRVTAESDALSKITGARRPSGKPIQDPNRGPSRSSRSPRGGRGNASRRPRSGRRGAGPGN